MIWPKKPKTPGFGISRNFYLTVLAAQASLPPPRLLVHPKGEAGAVQGFIVPLSSSATKEDLDRPLARGGYGVSTLDRKTVMRMLVLSKEEAGFDPSPFLRSEYAVGMNPDALARISATWTLMQLSFESHDPMVYDAVRFILQVAGRAASLTQGVVADPMCHTYKLPEQVWTLPTPPDLLDVRDVVRIWTRRVGGQTTSHTLGLQKFSLPELEMVGYDASLTPRAEACLLNVAQNALRGKRAELGDRVVIGNGQFVVAPGGLDRARWEGIECFELIPPPGKSLDSQIEGLAP